MHINEFPVEILSEIFEVSIKRSPLSTNEIHSYLRSFVKNRSPINLIHVCQQWRTVAFATPSLWTSISGEQIKASRTSIAAMKYWLQCSRKAPLHFRIASRWDSRERSFDRQHSRKMLATFATHSVRWHSLSIQAGHELARDLVVILQGADKNLPPLESLEINLDDERMPQSVVDDLTSCVYRLKETLRRLFWANNPAYAFPRHLPWGQLITVSILASFTIEEIMFCLTQCVSATVVKLHGFGRVPGRSLALSNHQPTTLPILTSLTLDRSCDPLLLLQLFTLPSLLSLEIELYEHNFVLLEDFLNRSKCPLQLLAVIDTTLSANDIPDFFNISYLKSIANVKLAPTETEKQMLQILEPLMQARAFLPPLVVWREWDSTWPLYVGWKESAPRNFLYSYKNGNLAFPPKKT